MLFSKGQITFKKINLYVCLKMFIKNKFSESGWTLNVQSVNRFLTYSPICSAALGQPLRGFACYSASFSKLLHQILNHIFEPLTYFWFEIRKLTKHLNVRRKFQNIFSRWSSYPVMTVTWQKHGVVLLCGLSVIKIILRAGRVAPFIVDELTCFTYVCRCVLSLLRSYW